MDTVPPPGGWTSSDLSLWLTPMAALALLVTGDPAIAMEGQPKASAGAPRHYVPPPEDGAETGSAAWRRARMGHPDDWSGLDTGWLASWAGSTEAVTAAQNRLVEALQSGRVRTVGRLTVQDAYEPLDPDKWAAAALVDAGRNYRRLVGTRRTHDGTLHPAADLADVLLNRDHVLALLPGAEDAVRPAPPRDIALADLPDWWTLEQACAWIALRDAAAVAGAAPPRHGRDETGRVAWHANYLIRQASNQPVGPSPTDSLKVMQAPLAAGSVRSKGVQSGGNRPQSEISPYSWMNATIVDMPPHIGGKRVVFGLGGIAASYDHVVVARDDMVREWLPDSFAEAAHVKLATTTARPKRQGGGRPERPDWAPFDKEMLRIVGLDAGNLSLPEFKRKMKDWAAENMVPAPDDRTIERRISARTPDGIFISK